MEENKKCTYDGVEVKGIIHVPSIKKYMCKSVRQFYVKKQFIEKGMSREDAEKLSKEMIKN